MKNKLKIERQAKTAKFAATVLEEALVHQVANLGRGGPLGANEFYSCYTYGSGKMPAWVKRAKEAVIQAHRTGVRRTKVSAMLISGGR